jgi:hypothetical protein
VLSWRLTAKIKTSNFKSESAAKEDERSTKEDEESSATEEVVDFGKWR